MSNMMFLRCAGRKTARLETSIPDGIIAQYRARQGEIMLLSEDEIILWRLALPRAGWWRKAQRDRLPTRRPTQSQSKAKRAANAKRGCGSGRGRGPPPRT